MLPDAPSSPAVAGSAAAHPWHSGVVRTTTGPAILRVAAALWIVAGLGYLVTEAVVAKHLPGYSYSANYISDLGRPLHSPLAAWMNGAFIAQGVAFALAGALVVTAARPGPGIVAFLGLAVIYGAGSTAVGLFPSGGTAGSALVHVGGATAAILAGNLAVLAAGVVLLRRRRFRGGVASVALGVAGLFSGGLLLCSSVPSTRVPFGDGAWERGAIYAIIGWQLLAGIAALAIRRQASSADSESAPTARP